MKQQFIFSVQESFIQNRKEELKFTFFLLKLFLIVKLRKIKIEVEYGISDVKTYISVLTVVEFHSLAVEIQ